MKRAFTLLLFPLFAIAKLGADDVETVSVLEGDSVTLNTGLTELQRDDVIEWRFNGILIARINSESNNITVWVKSDGDRLQMNSQTGNLKIKSIRTTDFGQYILKITSTWSSSAKFNISGVPLNKVLSVPVEDSVTLHAGVANTQKYDVIQWRLGSQKTLVGKINRLYEIFSTYDGPNGTFRGRLLLDRQTGSLTITNTRTTDSGLYEVEIMANSGKHTIHKTYTVIVTGESMIESVNEGELLFLQTDVIEIQTDDQILWMFEKNIIAKISKGDNEFLTYNGPDERFRDRLKLDHQTGSLTITNTRTTDSGIYTLQIIGSTNKHKRITVTVSEKSKFPTDILLGVLLAIAIVALGVMYIRKYPKKNACIIQNDASQFPLQTEDMTQRT